MDLSRITISPTSSIKQCLEMLGTYNGLRILLVKDNYGKFIGIITDPDIRRALLTGFKLDDPIETIIQKNPITAHINTPKEMLIELASKHNIYQIPLVDDDGIIVRIEKVLQNLITSHKNYIVIMAGGLGTRLKPLTDNCPKPMLKVGDKPIMEIILNRFKKQGFHNFILCVNYKSHMIEQYFLDGSNLGINIQYTKETKRLGTAGGVLLSKELIKNNEDIFVTNGDVLCDLNLEQMLNFHKQNKSLATMGVRKMHQQIPYGVIEQKDSKIISISEKPEQEYLINAGIYCLSQQAIDAIPKDKFFDMTDLFRIIAKEKLAFTYQIMDYWIDIGMHEELARARSDLQDFQE